jgi:hypothetical protein
MRPAGPAVFATVILFTFSTVSHLFFISLLFVLVSCFRRVSRLARHSLNILCPQLGFAFSLLCDGYMNVEQWVCVLRVPILF